MNNQICTNKPTNIEERSAKEMRVYDLLDNLGIGYRRLDHEPAATIDDCHDVDKLLGIELCKNLFLCNAQKTDFYLLLLQGQKKFKTKDLSKQINSARLSFADGAYMEEFLDITPGAVSVMGLMNDKEQRVRLLVDKDVYETEYLGCHPCVNTASLKIKTGDVLGKFLEHTGHDMTIVEL